MIDNTFKQFFDTPHITETIKDLDARQLERGVGLTTSVQGLDAVEVLRLGAITSLVELIGDYRVDIWFRPSGGEVEGFHSLAQLCFLRWRGYFDALVESHGQPSLDDMIMFAAVGMIAERDHQVREELRQPRSKKWLDTFVSQIKSLPWLDQVRANINAAILYLIRQENHSDIRQGDLIMQTLADIQRRTEASWIADRPSQKRDAATLLGLYHLAESVILTARFLANGSVEVNGKSLGDFAAELRRLLVKSEEFLQYSGDSEQILWLQATASALAHLRSSSIWVQAKGISERIDQLVIELARTERQQPVFSLLPAQQDALRQSLLDSSRMAIVLQMPTSAGKTLLAEFSIVQTFDAFRGKSTRAVYLVPTRALATQVRRTLTEDLNPLNIKVATVGSAFEEDPYEIKLLKDSDGVIVCTPEKLDLLLRAHPDWFASLRLVVVDEAHLIQDHERGARLELLLANIRREQPEARLLLLTPFMENANEIAQWLSRERPRAISVQWRPTRVLLGMAKVAGSGAKRSLTINWIDPYDPELAPRPLHVPTQKPQKELASNSDKVLFLADKFQSFGTVLAIFSASPSEAEEAAIKQARKLSPKTGKNLSPQIRVAIAIARHEFGNRSKLAYCLQRGVAFHHSSLSPILRYLVEDQIRDKNITFVAATSTLAQGMNFPVSSILVHSVHKPYGGGDFTPSEFWNMAGRAGRIGLAEKGLVVFANPAHQKHLDRYSQELRNSLRSAMLMVLDALDPEGDLKQQYRDIKTIRPFIQYLAHAAATSSATEAIRNLEALLEQSLVNQQNIL
jgi:helicase